MGYRRSKRVKRKGMAFKKRSRMQRKKSRKYNSYRVARGGIRL
jgi:hypothetical protein